MDRETFWDGFWRELRAIGVGIIWILALVGVYGLLRELLGRSC